MHPTIYVVTHYDFNHTQRGKPIDSRFFEEPLINSQFPSCTIFWPISHKTQQTLVTDYVIVGFCAI